MGQWALCVEKDKPGLFNTKHKRPFGRAADFYNCCLVCSMGQPSRVQSCPQRALPAVVMRNFPYETNQHKEMITAPFNALNATSH